MVVLAYLLLTSIQNLDIYLNGLQLSAASNSNEQKYFHLQVITNTVEKWFELLSVQF